MKKRTNLQKLRAEADKLWQIECQKLAPRCLICGHRTQVCHHFFPKSIASALRYVFRNGIQLCNICHFKLHNGDPTISAKILKIKGEKWLNKLIILRKNTIQITVGYFRDIMKDLTLLKKDDKIKDDF